MSRLPLMLVIFLVFGNILSQEINGNQLLEKAIAYHDPSDNWEDFKGKLFITMETPNSNDRVSEISINHPAEYFKLKWHREKDTVIQKLDKNYCFISLNGSEKIPEDRTKELRLTCDRTKTMRDYYVYLYGLPMKLKDPGTIIDPVVQKRTFKGKEYLVLKANYEEPVGGVRGTSILTRKRMQWRSISSFITNQKMTANTFCFQGQKPSMK